MPSAARRRASEAAPRRPQLADVRRNAAEPAQAPEAPQRANTGERAPVNLYRGLPYPTARALREPPATPRARLMVALAHWGEARHELRGELNDDLIDMFLGAKPAHRAATVEEMLARSKRARRALVKYEKALAAVAADAKE